MENAENNKNAKILKQIQKNLIEERKKKGLTQKEVAKKLNKSPQYVAKMEQSDSPAFTFRKLNEFAKVYKVHSGEFLEKKIKKEIEKNLLVVKNPVRVIRRNSILEKGIEYFSLTQSNEKETFMDSYQVYYAEWNNNTKCAKHSHLGEEFFFMLEGNLYFTLLSKESEVVEDPKWNKKEVISYNNTHNSNSMWLDGTLPHQVETKKAKAKAIIVFCTPDNELMASEKSIINSKDLIVLNDKGNPDKINLETFYYGLGYKIKEARLHSNKTVTELAKEINISKSELSKIENHQSDPKITTLAKIAEILKVELDSFFSDNNRYHSFKSSNSFGFRLPFNSAFMQLDLMRSNKNKKSLSIKLLKVNNLNKTKGKSHTIIGGKQTTIYVLKGSINAVYSKELSPKHGRKKEFPIAEAITLTKGETIHVNRMGRLIITPLTDNTELLQIQAFPKQITYKEYVS